MKKSESLQKIVGKSFGPSRDGERHLSRFSSGKAGLPRSEEEEKGGKWSSATTKKAAGQINVLNWASWTRYDDLFPSYILCVCVCAVQYTNIDITI